MNYKMFFLFISFILSVPLNAQYVPIIEVPDEIEFAGMRLKITSRAKKLLQDDVSKITKNARYFNTMVERANLYFPLIEKVFEEESFPKDFKYLALQESSLVSDAVSSSNAVGYWQFKKESAVEVGLRVDNKIDERMNIISSSRGASRYLKRNNQTHNNWIYSLLSYNVGLGGSKSLVDQKFIGESKMTIDEDMHWYVIRFLAHKLVYQHAIEKSSKIDSVLVEYIHGANKSITDIALENNLDKERLLLYNKWLKTEVIPDDKIYPVIIAVPMSQASAIAKVNKMTVPVGKPEKIYKEKYSTVAEVKAKRRSDAAYTIVINGVNAIIAYDGDNIVKLSAKGNISKDAFLSYNEMQSFEEITSGKIYYLSKKKKKANVMFHTVQYGETIWDIAQNYAIKISSIKKYNRMDKNEAIDVGRVLWLRSKRPSTKPIEYKPVIKPEVKPIEKESSTKIENTAELNGESEKLLFHIVQTGETLFGISKKYDTPTDSIMVWNGLLNYSVSAGQKLIVRLTKQQVESLSYHIVISGDTFYKIARLYNISVDDLMKWNGKSDMNIKPGDKLIIKNNNP